MKGDGAAACFEAEVPQHRPRLQPEIVLVQALIKPAKLEIVARMATEIGASEIVLVETARSLSSAESRGAFKQGRIARVVRDAVRQSERCYLPKVHEPMSWSAWLATVSSDAGGWILSARAEASQVGLRWSAGGRYVIVGPEGGFTEDELRGAREVGMNEVGLGLPILRAETAAVVALSLARHTA